MNEIKNVFVTGGAGYVGSVLIPKLLNRGYHVKVLDLYIYGNDVLKEVKDHPNLKEIKGDIRDRELLEKEIPGTDAIIHLACISNDPSYELNPELGKSINYDAFLTLIDVAKESKIKRFIYASSSSVYGIKNEKNVTEELALEPLTDYAKYKAKCEDALREKIQDEFTYVIIRPATVCGYSPRLRLDLTVNILTNHAVNNGKIKVFGGDQMRPNIHINDMTDLYIKLLNYSDKEINKKVFNAGYENYKVKEIAEMVQDIIGDDITIETTPSDDKRSYRVNSEKIKQELGFKPKYKIEQAISDLSKAFSDGIIADSMDDIRYYNIKTMQAVDLQ